MYMVVIISYTYVFFNRAVLIYGNKFMLLLISMLVQEELGCLSGNGSAELYGATVLCLLYVNIKQNGKFKGCMYYWVRYST